MSDKAREKVRMKVDVEDILHVPASIWYAPFEGFYKDACERLIQSGWSASSADLATRKLRQKQTGLKTGKLALEAGEVVEVVLACPREGEPESETDLLVENNKGAQAWVTRGDTEPAHRGTVLS
jgi:hypothetical protein